MLGVGPRLGRTGVEFVGAGVTGVLGKPVVAPGFFSADGVGTPADSVSSDGGNPGMVVRPVVDRSVVLGGGPAGGRLFEEVPRGTTGSDSSSPAGTGCRGGEDGLTGMTSDESPESTAGFVVAGVGEIAGRLGETVVSSVAAGIRNPAVPGFSTANGSAPSAAALFTGATLPARGFALPSGRASATTKERPPAGRTSDWSSSLKGVPRIPGDNAEASSSVVGRSSDSGRSSSLLGGDPFPAFGLRPSGADFG